MDNVELLTEISKLVVSLMGVTMGCWSVFIFVFGWMWLEKVIYRLALTVLERYKLNPVVVWSCSFLLGLLSLGFLICCSAYTIQYFVLNFLKWFYP